VDLATNEPKDDFSPEAAALNRRIGQAAPGDETVTKVSVKTSLPRGGANAPAVGTYRGKMLL